MMGSPHMKVRFGRLKAGGNGTGGGCDEDCKCIESVFRFQDDFCGRVPVPDPDNVNDNWDVSLETQVGAGSLVAQERSGGWWKLCETGGGGQQTSTLSQPHHCWSARQPAKPTFKFARVHYKTKLFATLQSMNGLGTVRAGLFNSQQQQPNNPPVGVYFDNFGGPQWQARLKAPTGGDMAAGAVTITQSCDGVQLFEIIMSSAGVQYLIDGTEVAFFSTTGPNFGPVNDILSDVLKAFYQISAVPDGTLACLDIDYVCITQTPRLCTLKQRSF